jgi:hypothetical protein
MHLLSIQCVCPAHSSLFNSTTADIHGLLYNLYNSLLYLILHLLFSFTGPHIRLSIFQMNQWPFQIFIESPALMPII